MNADQPNWQAELVQDVLHRTRHLLLREFDGGHLHRMDRRVRLVHYLSALSIAEFFRTSLDAREQDEIDLAHLADVIRSAARDACG